MKVFSIFTSLVLGTALFASASAAPPPPVDIVTAEKCDGGSGIVQGINYSDSDESTDHYHASIRLVQFRTNPPGENYFSFGCQDIAVPNYSLPAGNVSPWFPNNSEHVVTCDDLYQGTKVIVRGEYVLTYQRYEVYSTGGQFLYETVRGGYNYPNGFRQNTIRYSTTRCTGH